LSFIVSLVGTNCMVTDDYQRGVYERVTAGIATTRPVSCPNALGASSLAALGIEERSWTGARRRALLWRALLLAIVGTALFFYFRPRHAPTVLRRVPPEQLR